MDVTTKPTAATNNGDNVCLLEVVDSVVVELNVASFKAFDEFSDADQDALFILITVTVVANHFRCKKVIVNVM